jgi:hypothetical protein
MPGDKPYRVFFPEPLLLHGTNPEKIRMQAIEYLKQAPELRIRIEPQFAPEATT